MLVSTIWQTIKNFFRGLMAHERSTHRLALTFSVGIYIAFSPFPGFHTIMVLLSGWLFNLSIPVLLASSILINNPWTMLPVYGAGHVVGQWLCGTVCGYDMYALNPGWMKSLNTYVTHYTGLQGLSLWSFLIGGNLLGILFAFLFYPLMRYIFTQLAPYELPSNIVRNPDENHSSK